jgi:hypothetical protein
MKQTIEQAVASVQNAFPSIYTKDDVIKLLGSIEAPKGQVGLSPVLIDQLIQVVVDQVRSNAENLETDEVCDVDSAEFDLNGNEISLSSVDVNTRGIADAIVDCVGDEIEAFFENLKVDEEDE